MTLDEAIKHCIEIAEEAEAYKAEVSSPVLSATVCKCGQEHRQLAEWLEELRARRHCMDKICAELAELYGSPCQYNPQEQYMCEMGFCEDCTGDVPDSECWHRYFNLKLGIGGTTDET